MKRTIPSQDFKTIQNSQLVLEQEFSISDELLRNHYRKHHQKSTHRKERYLKLICIAFLLSGFLSYRFGNSLNINTNCILDSYQQSTFNVNRKLSEGWDNLIIGIGQLIMDIWIGVMTLFWMIRIKNFRLPAAVSLFYLVRSCFLLIQKFPFPQNIVWHNPGFISLTVPYDHTRDFFYSGHTGSLTIILIQFSQLTVQNSRKVAGYVWVLAFICLIYMMNMLIITRVHYTADIIGGLVYSVYFYWVISLYTIWIDKIMSLPYVYVIKPLINKLQGQRNDENSAQNDLQSPIADHLQQRDKLESDHRR